MPDLLTDFLLRLGSTLLFPLGSLRLSLCNQLCCLLLPSLRDDLLFDDLLKRVMDLLAFELLLLLQLCLQIRGQLYIQTIGVCFGLDLLTQSEWVRIVSA